MGRPSTLTKLPADVLDKLHSDIRAGHYTIDDLTARLRDMLGDAAPSRGAVGRYVKSAREQMAVFAEAQEVAKVWVERLETEPDGDVARLMPQMLRTIAFQTMTSMGQDGEVEPSEIMLLARAIKDTASADNLTAKRILVIREEERKRLAAKMTEAVDVASKEQGLSEDTAAIIRQAIEGEVNG